MDEKLAQCNQHYEKLVNYFLNQYKFKANLISYQDFLVGYSLFEIGAKMGYDAQLITLNAFLQYANVQTKPNSGESQKVLEIQSQLQAEMEERKSGR